MQVLVPLTSPILAVYPDTNGWAPQAGGRTYAPYSAGSPYAVGDRVSYLIDYYDYECIQAHSTPNQLPGVPSAYWARIGRINALKPFDGVVTQQAVGYTYGDQLVDSMKYRVISTGRFTTVAVLNCDAATVRVKFTNPDGVVTYNKVISAVDTTPIVDAWTYCFADCDVQRHFIFDGIDGWGTGPLSRLDVIIGNDGTGIPIRVGEIILGESFDLGTCLAEAKLGLTDYSIKEFDAYGNASIVQRTYTRDASFSLDIPAAKRNKIQNLMELLRATPCVWFPSESDANDGLVVYGFLSDFYVTYSTPTAAFASLEVKGLS